MTTPKERSFPRVFKIKLPLRVNTSSKKKQALNLNVYRNLHHRSLHAQKKSFEKIAKKLLSGIPPLGVIHLHYVMCPQTKRRMDIMNVGSIIDKYFSDTLTEVGIIEDDDYTHIPKVTFEFGALVSEEYVLATITEIERRSTPMRVLLDYDDIQAALTTYVGTLNIPNASGVKLSADELGDITAEVMFLPNEELVSAEIPEETPKPVRRKRRTKEQIAADNAKEVNANVDETAATGADSGDGGDTPEPEGGTEEVIPTETGIATDTKPVAKVTSKGNLFGDSEPPSSEDDGETPAVDPVPAVVPPKKGSIFDA